MRRSVFQTDACIALNEVGGQQEVTHAFVLGHGVGTERAVGTKHFDRVLHSQAPAVGELEGNALGHALHAPAPFGVEIEQAVGALLHDIGARGAQGNPLVGRGLRNEQLRDVRLGHILRPFQGLARTEHGNHTREASFRTPIDHFAGEGAQLMIAGVDRRPEREGSASRAQAVELQCLLFHLLAVGIEQFHVEHAAQGSGLERGGAHHVGFVPNGVAREVGGLIQVEVHFLAGVGEVETGGRLETFKQHFGCGLLGFDRKGKKKKQSEKYSKRVHGRKHIEKRGERAKPGLSAALTRRDSTKKPGAIAAPAVSDRPLRHNGRNSRRHFPP